MSDYVKTYSTFSETQRVFKEFVHTWKISDFNTIHPGAESSIDSRGYLNGQAVWQLQLYPDYSSTEIYIAVTFVKQFVSINNCPYLLLIYLLDKNEKEHKVYELKTFSCTTNYMDCYINRGFFKKEELLPNGDLIIRFKIYFTDLINVIPNMIQPISSCGSNEKFDELENNMFTEQRLSGDVKIVVGNKLFWVYKSILTNQSPVFAAMFEHNTTENNKNVIEIEDIDHEIIQEMLRFISVGKVRNMKNIASDLLVAADKYELEQLKNKCEESLINTLNLENMISLLIFAERYNANILKEKAVDFFKLHMKEIVKSEKYKAEIKNVMPILPKIIKSLMNE